MQRLSLTEFIVTIAILLLLAYGAGQIYQQFLVNLTTATFSHLNKN